MSSPRPPSLDDLPCHSPWPARLLGLEPWEPRQKTRAEILREYEREKWAPLLARFRHARAQGSPAGLADVDRWFTPSASEDTLVTVNDEWQFMRPTTVRERYLGLIESALARWCPRPDALVELGAGYGGVLLHLLRGTYSRVPAIGLDVCPSGVALLSEIARAEDLNVVAGTCDLTSPSVTDHAIPPRALFYTSYATSCVPNLPGEFVARLASFRPMLVVHFEPLFEHARQDTLLGLLRRRYVEVNGYDRSFLGTLRMAVQDGRIEILDELPNVFGANPLFAASVVVWRPR